MIRKCTHISERQVETSVVLKETNTRRINLRYFTGTGNTKRVAEIIVQALAENGYLVSCLPITDDCTADPQDNEYLGFAFPVYSWGIPRLVRGHLRSLPAVNNGRKAFIIVTSGGKDEEGWALTESRKILAAKGYVVTNSDAINMPNNWIVLSNPPAAEERALMLENGEQQAGEFARELISGIESNKDFVWPRLGPLALLSNYLFRYIGVYRLWRLFKTDLNCSSCGLCCAICPTKGITIYNGKPVWSAKCEQCMRCINFCPKKAIQQLELIGKGSMRDRYHEPHFEPQEF